MTAPADDPEHTNVHRNGLSDKHINWIGIAGALLFQLGAIAAFGFAGRIMSCGMSILVACIIETIRGRR